MQVHFGPTAYDDPIKALTRLKKTTTIAVFKAQFESKLSCFFNGLEDKIRLLIRLFNPINLSVTLKEEYIGA